MTDLEPAHREIDLEEVMSSQALNVLTKGSDESFLKLAGELGTEEMVDAVAVLSHVSRSSSLRAGYLLYRLRTMTPDGDWGQTVWKFANDYEVSQRTIHRWMAAAQAHFDLELTPAQKNAKVSADAAAGRQQDKLAEEEPTVWDDEDEDDVGLGEGYMGWDPDQGKDVWIPGPDPDAEPGTHPLLDSMNDEAGWGDSTLPSADYENAEVSSPAGAAPAVAPDETWVQFTMAQIQQEHENFSDQAAERSAKARWSRKIETEPLDLLEELEMIYESEGGTVPDEIVESLHAAEDNKAIKPDEVTTGKKERAPKKPKSADSVAEKALHLLRELHGQVHNGLKDGSITQREVAAMLPHVQLMPHTVAGLKKLAQDAKDLVGETKSPIQERIAATQAEEAASSADF